MSFIVFLLEVEEVYVVLVNEALRPKFLDLKEGATVISLAPFVSSINARLTKRNVRLSKTFLLILLMPGLG